MLYCSRRGIESKIKMLNSLVMVNTPMYGQQLKPHENTNIHIVQQSKQDYLVIHDYLVILKHSLQNY